MAANRNFVKKDALGPIIQARIASLQNGTKRISGSLTVTAGHSYWWFLEYGTGPFFDPESEDELQAPAAAEGHTPEGQEYEITIKDDPILIYMLRTGERRFRKPTVIHPGIRPLGFIHTALFEAEIRLKSTLTRQRKKAKRIKELPGREQLVEIVNGVLHFLLRTLQFSTPPDSDIDPFHEGRHPVPLAQAWRITKAK